MRGGFDVLADLAGALDDAGNEIDPVLREVLAAGPFGIGVNAVGVLQGDRVDGQLAMKGNLRDGEIWYEERNRLPALFSDKWPDFHALFVPPTAWDVYCGTAPSLWHVLNKTSAAYWRHAEASKLASNPYSPSLNNPLRTISLRPRSCPKLPEVARRICGAHVVGSLDYKATMKLRSFRLD